MLNYDTNKVKGHGSHRVPFFWTISTINSTLMHFDTQSLSSLSIKDPCPIAKLDDGYASNRYLTPICIH